MRNVSLPIIVIVIAAIGTLWLYAVDPLWPSSVARFPWKMWALPILFGWLLAQFLFFRELSIAKAVTGALLVTGIYFFLEVTIGTLVFSSVRGWRLPDIEGLLFVGAINVLSQCGALAVWVAGVGLHAYMYSRRRS